MPRVVHTLNVKIWVKWFGTNDNPLGLPNGDGTGDPGDYTYLIPIEANQSANGYMLSGWFNDHFGPGNWAQFANIRKVQFVIEMSSADVNSTEIADQPWVETVSLGYELNAVEVGIINFTDGEATHKTVAAGGASVTFNMTATPLADFDSQAKRVDLGIDWGGAAPVGVSYVINPSFIYPFSPALPVTSVDFVVTFTADTGAEIDVDHNFSVTGHLAGELERILRPAAGTLSVSGTINPAGDFSLEFVGEHVRSVRPGGSAVYQILVKSVNSFSGSVTLSTDIITGHKFATGAIASPTFDRNPVTPTPEGNPVILSVGVDATAQEEGPHTFAITGTATGTAGSIIHSLTNASLQIDNDAPEQPAITVHTTIPTETTKGTEQPQFVFRLYPAGATTRAAWVYQKTGILPSEFTGDIVDIVVPDGLVTDAQKYIGYAKSTRHLWKKSSDDFIVNASGTSQIYNLTFPQLVAGNVGPTPDAGLQFLNDDIINTLDYAQLFQEWARIFTTLIADFNNDGVVNSADIIYILGQGRFGQAGDLLTNLPN